MPSSAEPSAKGLRAGIAGGDGPPTGSAAAPDAARLHWEQLGAKVHGDGGSPGASFKGKGMDVDFTKVMNDGAPSDVWFSLLHSFRFDKWLWMRIGEALHPGPKAPHRPSKVGLTKGDVKRLVKSMVMQLAEQFFGQAAGHVQAPASSAQPAKGKGKDIAAPPGKGKGRQDPNDGGKGNKGAGKGTEGKDGRAVPSPPWRRPRGPGGADASAATSSDLGLQTAAKGKGKHADADKGKGTGKDGIGPGAGAGRAEPAARARRWQRDGWQQVKWKLRPQDLNFSVVISAAETLERELDKGEAVLVYTDNPRELEEFGELMRGGCHPQSLLVFDGEATPELDNLQSDFPVERRSLPGVLRGGLKLRKCWVVAMQRGQPEVGELPLDVEVDFLEARPPKQRSAYKDSVVIRACCAQCFADKDRWKRIVHRPGAAVRDWIARVGGSPADLLDCWAWEKAGDSQAILPTGVVKGLLRLSPSAARVLLAAGGRCAGGATFFFQPLNWADLTLNQPALLWETQRADEPSCEYLRRVVALSGDMGLFHDGKRLAVRIDPRDPRNAARQGLWHLRQVPFGWHVAELEEVLKDVGFEQVEVQARYRDRRAARWSFLALRADRRDYVPIKIEDEDMGVIELEASRHRRQGRKEPTREAIKPERRQSVAFGSHGAADRRGKGAGKGTKGAAAEAASGGPEPGDPFDDLITLDADLAVETEEGDIPMTGNKRQAAAVAPVAKKPKQPKMVLPDGATIISNEGGGNCLPAAVAQALTSHGGKQVSHRGVRRAMTRWMREQAAHLQPLWDGRDTQDRPCHLAFSEYLSAVEAVGSWCGNLEVYALSRGLPANLLVMDFDSETMFKFASQADSDPFVVLKFASKHYEWIKCSPEALVDIWCHAAVGSTAGGRGGGFMSFDSASESSAAALAQPSGAAAGDLGPMMVIDPASRGDSGAPPSQGSRDCGSQGSAPSVVGGHMAFDVSMAAALAQPSEVQAGDLGPMMVIDPASRGDSGAPPSQCSRDCGSKGLVPSVVGGHMVFDNASAAGSGSGRHAAARSSSSQVANGDSVRACRSSRTWPTPADLRSLSSASARPVVLPPRRRLRAKTNNWVSLAAVAKEGATDDVPVEADSPVEPPPAPPVEARRRQGYVSKYKAGDVVRWPCPLCPMVIETTSPTTMQKRRYEHCHRQHGGQGLPGTKRVNFDAFRTLSSDEPEDWRCPLCDWGLPAGTRGGMTSATFAKAKEQHRKAKHRHLSPQEYLARIKARGAQRPAARMRARVRLLNAGVAKRQKEGLMAPAGWKLFRWPFVANKKKKRVLKVTQAWSCLKCNRCTRVAKLRPAHEWYCQWYDRSILEGVRARHRESFEEAKTLDHGMDPELLRQLYVNADLAMGGDGQLS